MSRNLVAEAQGTALLLVAVVGSGIMAERLAGGNVAVALLANVLATGAALVVLITVFGPLSGAHFNPCVTLYAALNGGVTWPDAAIYTLIQFVAAIGGVWLAHAMFAVPMLEISSHLRDGPMVGGIRSHLRPVAHDCGRRPFYSPNSADAGWSLYNRRLLFHRLNLLCQPRRHRGAHVERQFCRHRPLLRARIHSRTIARDLRGMALPSLAVRQGGLGSLAKAISSPSPLPWRN
jgi:hypothetical protein